MEQFIEKLIGRLEEKAYNHFDLKLSDAIEIVNELAEEYKDKSGIIDDLKIFLKEKFNYCAEQAGMNLEAECNSEIASYFRDRKELYLDRANIYGEVMREIDRLSEEHKGGWIPCSERLPEEKGDYLVTCNDGKVRVWWFVVEGDFKCWLRGVRHLKPIAWQPLPEPYKTEGEQL